MSDEHRTRRLGSAPDLQAKLDALGKVPEAHRGEFIHDRLMSAIDDIFDSHKKPGGQCVFTKQQIVAIKDISYHIVFLLDNKGRQKRGFLRAIWDEFCLQSPIKKIGTIAAAVAGIIALAAASINLYDRITFSSKPEAEVSQRPEAPAPASRTISKTPNN
ncbi:hypothetical protein [Xanthobacter autotrophicus]|uniref:hypothetical protein n=1 Tax=Xanthobacter autotrophicus TaxID=280 RepID=UPI0024A6298A|nr:hypothetical protein [Xanthobacter autotrophicus]MDI4657891.1 hypothetical protein [Xanthobacter autotrophicus]